MKGLLAFILLIPVLLSGQNYVMNGTPITDCTGTFYDPGGSAGNYGNNQNFSTTICSDGGGGTHIRLSFSGADLAPGDVLCFYDGTSAAAPLLSCAADYPVGQPFVVQATATNPSGCLTVVFQSNTSGVASGWAAAISCVASCQTILADLVSTNPASLPLDTGWIDICPGERVFFTGAGLYPQNNFAYAQSDFTTSFEWNFGDGGISYGPNTSHRFTEPGGYLVQLTLTDTLGCKNSNLISQRIRVASKPDFGLQGVGQICAGDTLYLNASVDTSLSGTIVSVIPVTGTFDAESSRSDSLPLPDGTGELYETSIFLTNFSPGQVLVSANDLQSICVNIEHSWMRDLEITLTCPSGQQIILHDHPGNIGGQVFLGEPNDNDNFNPVPGLGYDYCWTPNAPNPTWIQYANNTGVGTLPPGDYSTFDPIIDLVGCPLNGEWTIGVTDLWAADNGYIFNWSIAFQDFLYPNIETFTPQFVTWGWNNHPSIFFSTADSLAASPQNAGSAGYRFSVTDDFGCTWDTLVNVAVLPPTHPNCYTCASNFPVLRDTVICAGDPVSLDVTSSTPTTQEVRFESYPDYRIGNANHPNSNPYLSPISVNSVGYNFLTNPIQQITSVCLDLETDFASDINLFLRAPGGQQLMLSTGNGGSGDNYKVTCFSPTATVPIIGQAAPFNGTFIPEGNWNALAGAAVTGNWSLVVSDGFAPAQFGRLLQWSIGFNTQNNVVYNWSNAASLSCNNCPNPSASPLDTTQYVLTATDAFNCIHTDTVVVQVRNFFPAPTGLLVFQLGLNTMTWVWNAVPGALGYEVSVNGGPWEMPNNGALSHIVSGVLVGETVDISVRSIAPNACVPEVVSASSVFPNCIMFGNVFSQTAVPCWDDTTGSVILSVSNATFPVLFFVDTLSNPFLNGDILNILSGGPHSIIILDALGCRDTVNFVISAPPPIVVNALGMNVLCNGDNSGTLTATATGGTGNVAFAWRNCLGGSTLGGPNQDDLFAGCYEVTATDANGCTQTASVTLTEPPAYVFVTAQDSVSCAGLSDGGASVSVTGGLSPYTYLWDNNALTSTATGFSAGFHFVTVTDANLCSVTTFVEVLEPPVLSVLNVISSNATCFSLQNGSATVLVSGGVMPYTYLWNDPAVQTTQQASMLGSGPYSVIVTDQNGCANQGAVTITAPPELALTVQNVQAEICAGDCTGQATLTPSGGVGGYAADWADNGIPDQFSVTNLCPGVYPVTLSDNNGCTETTQVSILAAVPLVVSFVETDPLCLGAQNGSIDASIIGGSTPYLYQWSTGSAMEDLQNLPCGPYLLTLTDGVGCVQNYSVDLNCPSSIVVTNISMQSVGCFGANNGAATVMALGGVGNISYAWDDNNLQTTPTATNLSAGTYAVTVTDANGCNTSTSIVVTQPNALTVSSLTTNASCLNAGDGTATAQAMGGTSPYQYQWAATLTTQTIQNLAAGTFTVTVTDANLCTATAIAAIGQPSMSVTATATQTRFACRGASDGEASVSATGGNGAPFTFIWSNGQVGGGASNLATGVYTVTATDGKGCRGTQTVAVQQLDSIKVLTAYTPPTCAGFSDGVVAIISIEGGLAMGDTTQYIYQWSLSTAGNSTVVTGFSAGMYRLTVSDFQGCSTSIGFNVLGPPALNLVQNVQNVSCFGLSDGSAAITSVQNAVGTVQYNWNTNANTAQISNLPVGIYRVTVTDGNTCSVTASMTLTQPNALQIVLQTQNLVCDGDSNGVVSAQISGGTPGYSYAWSNGATGAEIQDLGPGTYTLEITDANGCTLTQNSLLEPPPPLLVSAIIQPPSCFGFLDGRISLSVSGGRAPYRYRANGGAWGGSSVLIALGAGAYALEIQDANGCMARLDALITQPLPIEIDLGLDTLIRLGDSVVLTPTVNNAVGMTTFLWKNTLQDSIICVDLPDCEQIWAKPIFTNTYTLKVTDENGCMATDQIRVQIQKPRGIYVPTGFTPNGDLENDLLVVHGKNREVDKILIFRVFDRWGERVYEDQNFKVNDTARGWDGTFRGKACDPGVFVWVLEAVYLDGYVESLRGDVTLIR